MRVGTKSILFGVHSMFLHPVFVAAAWWRLYGFPCDPRLWFAFALHDAGYFGRGSMEGPEGETHVELGAKIMGAHFRHRMGGFLPAPLPLLRARTWTPDLEALCSR